MRRNHFVTLALLFSLLGGGILRFQGRNWDERAHLHPDERFLAMVMANISWPTSLEAYWDTPNSTFNPHNVGHSFFVYGTLPLLIGKKFSETFGEGPAYGAFLLYGRTLSAILDTSSIGLVFLLGGLVLSWELGALSALLYAFSILPIQHAHFFVVDPFLSFFCLTSLLALVLALRARTKKKEWVWFLLFGITSGMALSTKISAAPLLPLGFIIFYRKSKSLKSSVFQILISGILAFLTFRIFQPYAFCGPGFTGLMPNPKWLANLQELSRLSEMGIYFPPGIQWIKRSIFFGPWNFLIWGFGIPATLLALRGIFSLLTQGRPLTLPWATLVLWGLGIFAWASLSPNPTLRYYLPVYGVFAIFAAAGILSLKNEKTRNLIGGGAILFSLFSASAFTSIYRTPHPRLQATRFLFTLPAHQGGMIALANESSWDDGLPIFWPDLPSYDNRFMPDLNLELFVPDEPEKKTKMERVLLRSEWIAITSNRIYGAVTRLPQTYPETTAYYRNLTGCPENEEIAECMRNLEEDSPYRGTLGFRLRKVFQSNPSFLGISYSDQAAEEAFTVYDHPKVLLYSR